MMKSRNIRTAVLAVLATITFVASAIFIFDVEPRLMLGFFVASLVCLLLVVLAALLFTVLRHYLKRWW